MVIDRSRGKTLAALAGSVLFCVASVVICRLNPLVGVLGLTTFAVFGIFIGRALFEDGPGLDLDDEGFADDSSAGSVGRVLWADVTGISTWTHQGANVMVVTVRDPQSYIARLGAGRRRYAQINLKMMGTPVTIASNPLKIDYETLFSLFTQRLESTRCRGDSTPSS